MLTYISLRKGMGQKRHLAVFLFCCLFLFSISALFVSNGLDALSSMQNIAEASSSETLFLIAEK